MIWTIEFREASTCPCYAIHPSHTDTDIVDPGTALGVVSLVYDVTKDLYNFYRVWKDCEKDVGELRKQLLWLHEAFKVMRDTLQKPGLSDRGRKLIYSALQDCNDAANDLRAEVDKVMRQASPQTSLEKLKAQGRKACYPFKKSTVAGIAENVESCCEALHFAVDLLGLETISSMSQRLQEIDEKPTDSIDNVDINLVRLQTKVDLRNLTTAKGATYDSSAEGELPRCLPGTRVELLDDIGSWIADRMGKRILWLRGKAGTGKSTISRTVAQTLKEEKRPLATFFFKRGEANRKHAGLLIPTIARQLADTLPSLGRAIGKALDSDSLLCEKHLTVQFNDLLLQPIQEALQGSGVPDQIFIVMDALDECENTAAVEVILKLFRRLEEIATPRVRILITSRPETPIISEFRKMPDDSYHVIRLEKAQVQTIKSDLSKFIQHEFVRIKENYPAKHLFTSLPAEWPRDDHKRTLVDRSDPLFIVAFTFCKLVETAKNPEHQLDSILKQHHGYGSSTALADTYLPILRQAISADSGRVQQENLGALQTILGPLVLLNNPLSVDALTQLLDVLITDVEAILLSLQSVLGVPKTKDAPVKLFHLSFRDFLVDPTLQNDLMFWVDEPKTHGRLAKRCIHFLSANTLAEDICKVEALGTQRGSVERARIATAIPETVAYACCYWVQHWLASGQKLNDNGFIHEFLKLHFLHWMEAMSWLGKAADVIHSLEALQSVVNVEQGGDLLGFLNDASRFALRNRAIVDQAPLQIYLSALLFAPSKSIIRRTFGGELKRYLDIIPGVLEQWSAERLKLEGHERLVSAVAISADGKTVASGSIDRTVWLWSTATGEQTLKLEGHKDQVTAVAISTDGKTVASGSFDHTVRLWSTATGEQIQYFKTRKEPMRLHFTDDGNALDTDVGLLNLRPPSNLLHTSRSISEKIVVLDSAWVIFNGSIFLWLPQEYRGLCSATHGAFLVTGQASGAMSFFSFRA